MAWVVVAMLPLFKVKSLERAMPLAWTVTGWLAVMIDPARVIGTAPFWIKDPPISVLPPKTDCMPVVTVALKEPLAVITEPLLAKLPAVKVMSPVVSRSPSMITVPGWVRDPIEMLAALIPCVLK